MGEKCQGGGDTGDIRKGPVIETTTIGWKPSCSCDTEETVRPIVLDPFFGSGTVGLVAKKLNRDYIGIELNPEYIKMAEKRIRGKMGLFVKEEQ
ncbi:MAG TPA: site-specific DNA-methyltransferase [bacterium]|nr:site-specific DNA-methyltransferase [bacterium]